VKGDWLKMLIDDILSNWSNIYWFANELSPNEQGIIKHACFQKSISVNAQNVAEYYFNGGTPKELKLEDIINLAPPFENIWIEFQPPKGSHYQNIGRSGIALFYIKLPHGWNAICYAFSKCLDKTLICWGSLLVPINNDGEIISNGMTMLPSFEGNVGGPEPNLDKNMLMYLFVIAGVTISFMHCKNVKLIQNEIPEKLQKARIKRNKPPFIKNYTLEISPVKQILRKQGNIEKTGIKQALHICRGHFKDYRDGRGLFGKYQGLYWWEDQIRGNTENGTIIKDYKINLPEGGDINEHLR
jgi:hypothetical protein